MTYFLVPNPRLPSILFALVLIAGSAGVVEAQESPDPGASAAPAPLSPPRVVGRTLITATPAGERATELPCEPRALHASPDRVYAACGARGVVVVRLAGEGPVVEAVLAVAGEAVGFFVVGDRLWVETTETHATPIDALAARGPSAVLAAPPPAGVAMPPAQLPPPPALPSQPGAIRAGTVVEVDGGTVVVDLGTVDGIVTGMRVAFESPRDTETRGDGATAAMDAGDGGLVPGPLAIGEVVSAGDRLARVRLGIGELVPLGATARVVDAEVTRRRIAPPTVSGLSAYVFLRPMLSLSVDGLVASLDASVRYRGARDFFLLAEVSPLAGGLGAAEETGAFAARVLGAYDHRVFALGLGFGAAHTDAVAFDDFGLEREADRVRFTLEQHVRLGALDGLHVRTTNSFARGADGFAWANVRASFQIPAGPRSFVLLRGGGGNTRFQWGELAARHLIRGNGGSGSIFLEVAAGGAALQLDELELESYAGPHVGAGVEIRR